MLERDGMKNSQEAVRRAMSLRRRHTAGASRVGVDAVAAAACAISTPMSHLQNSNSTSRAKLTDFDSWQFLALIRRWAACGASPRDHAATMKPLGL